MNEENVHVSKAAIERFRDDYLRGLERARQIAEETGRGKIAALAIREEINRARIKMIADRVVSVKSDDWQQIDSEAMSKRIREHGYFWDAYENQKAATKAFYERRQWGDLPGKKQVFSFLRKISRFWRYHIDI